jgi:hypothetical protein
MCSATTVWFRLSLTVLHLLLSSCRIRLGAVQTIWRVVERVDSCFGDVESGNIVSKLNRGPSSIHPARSPAVRCANRTKYTNTQHHLTTKLSSVTSTSNNLKIRLYANLTSNHNMDPSIRAARPPPSRRALFQSSTRRQQPTSVVRPDTATIFQQPMDDELVERDEKGQYIVTAPSSMYKHLAQMREGADEETGTSKWSRDE